MIADFYNKHKGQTALIIGNGKSLERTPLMELAKQYTTFGANKIYEFPFQPDYWTCGDGLMIQDCVPWIMSHPEYTPVKFVPRDVPLPGAHPMTLQIGVGFSKDASALIYMGGTVSYMAMQLAYYMGFDRLLLVGMDHRYEAEKGGKPGSKFISDGNDPDHFGNGYFSAGRIYNRPELAATERYFYPLAKSVFRDIINLTPDSALTIFRKDKPEKYIEV